MSDSASEVLSPFHSNLGGQGGPVEAQGRSRVAVELAGLPASVVREEHEAAGIDAFEQHHARRGTAFAIGGGQGHRGGVGGLRFPRALEELAELLQGILGIH